MEPMAIEPDLVEEVARRLQLRLRRDVGVSGGMLLYSEHHRWVDFSLYVCPGFLSVLGIVSEGPHLGPEFDQEVLQSPLLDRALRALTGLSRDQIRERDPAAGMFDAEDLVEMAGNQLMMKIGARRLRPMSPELLSEFIEQTMAALSVSGIPLSMLCQQCGRWPGQRLLRPNMLYRLERLCQDCRPQKRPAAPPGQAGNRPVAEFLQPVPGPWNACIEEACRRLSLDPPEAFRIWDQPGQQPCSVTLDCQQGLLSGVVEVWKVRLGELHPEDLALLVAWDLALKHGQWTESQGATRKRYNTDLSEMFGSAFGMDLEELGRSDPETRLQALMQGLRSRQKVAEPEPPAAPSQPDRRSASQRLGASELAACLLYERVLSLLDASVSGSPGEVVAQKLGLSPETWQEACSRAQSQLRLEWQALPELRETALPEAGDLRARLASREAAARQLESLLADLSREAGQRVEVQPQLPWLLERLSAQPEDPNALLALAGFYHQTDAWEEALEICQRLLEAEPGHRRGQLLRSALQEQLSRVRSWEGPLPPEASWLETNLQGASR